MPNRSSWPWLRFRRSNEREGGRGQQATNAGCTRGQGDATRLRPFARAAFGREERRRTDVRDGADAPARRSEEHTSELQSRENLVCRLLHGKKKKRVHICR